MIQGLLVAAALAYGAWRFMLHVGNPLGLKPKPEGSISTFNCRAEGGVLVCDFGVTRNEQVVTLGRFPNDRKPKRVVNGGVPGVLELRGSGWVFKPDGAP